MKYSTDMNSVSDEYRRGYRDGKAAATRYAFWSDVKTTVNDIYGNPLEIKRFQCSWCNGVNREDTQYCPHCGARMDRTNFTNDD